MCNTHSCVQGNYFTYLIKMWIAIFRTHRIIRIYLSVRCKRKYVFSRHIILCMYCMRVVELRQSCWGSLAHVISYKLRTALFCGKYVEKTHVLLRPTNIDLRIWSHHDHTFDNNECIFSHLFLFVLPTVSFGWLFQNLKAIHISVSSYYTKLNTFVHNDCIVKPKAKLSNLYAYTYTEKKTS